MKKIFFVLIGLYSLLLMSGCATTSNSPLPYQGESAKYIYAVGHDQVKNGYYFDAINTFRSLSSQYPLQKYTELGNLDLIYSYYQNGQSEMSLAVASQFIRMYPSSEHLGYVYYMMGVIDFDNGRGLLQRRLPYDMDQHDPTSYKHAFVEFKHAILINPKANYVSDAKRRMTYINNTIGKYEYNIAKFYFDHDAYVAAINRANNVINKYSETTAVEKSLVLIIKSYNMLKMPKLAQQYIDTLKLNYPDSAYLKILSGDASTTIS